MADRSSDQTEDEKLERLKRFSIHVAGQSGLLLHNLYLSLIRPDEGNWFLEGQQADPQIPPWPTGGNNDPYKQQFGPMADGMRILTKEEFEQLIAGGDPNGTKAEPDFTKKEMGTPYPPIPTDRFPYRRTDHMPDGSFEHNGTKLPSCGLLWLYQMRHKQTVAQCNGLDFSPIYRATLLKSIAEAHRLCKERDASCPDAILRLLWANWACSQAAEGGPQATVEMLFVVICDAN